MTDRNRQRVSVRRDLQTEKAGELELKKIPPVMIKVNQVSVKTMYYQIEVAMSIARLKAAGSSVTGTAGHGLIPVLEHQAVVQVFSRTGRVWTVNTKRVQGVHKGQVITSGQTTPDPAAEAESAEAVAEDAEGDKDDRCRGSGVRSQTS